MKGKAVLMLLLALCLLGSCDETSGDIATPTAAAVLSSAQPTDTIPLGTETPSPSTEMPTLQVDTPIPSTNTPVPPTETSEPTAINTATPTATNTPTPTATEPPTATPSPTAFPEELKTRILNTYGATVMIQLNAEGTYEIADGLASGELASLEAGLMRLTVVLLVDQVENLIPVLDPPDPLIDPWEDALEVHEQTKDILRRWFNEEIDSEQVVTEMPPILDAAEKAARDAEEAIDRAYDLPAEGLTAMRQEVLREWEAAFEPTATP